MAGQNDLAKFLRSTNMSNSAKSQPRPKTDKGLTESEIRQTFGDAAYLEHFGIKGMKWGVRKNRGKTPPKPMKKQPVKLQVTPGKRVVATGGVNYRPSEDAQRHAKSRQKAKMSTTDALSDKELKDLLNRMNMEKQYHQLTAPQKAPAEKAAAWVGGMLMAHGKQQLSRITGVYATKAGEQTMSKINLEYEKAQYRKATKDRKSYATLPMIEAPKK